MVRPQFFGSVDGWLWPHSFKPVPNLRNTIVICHDMIHRHYPAYFARRVLALRRQAEQSLQRCELILCPSQTTAHDLLNAYPQLESRVQLFTEAPSEVLAPREHVEETERLSAHYGDVPVFLYVGVDWPHKNHALLIEAALHLEKLAKQPFKVVFVGHRRTDTVARQIELSSASEVVVDVGSVSRAELAAWYRHAIALVFPSLFEGFGIPLVEAMHYGLPIIASNKSCIPEICGDSAHLLEPDDADAWASVMHSLMVNPDRRDEMQRLAGNRAGKYGWQQTWQQIDKGLATVF